MALLETRGLTVRYGGLVAVRDVDLRVPEGGLVGLIGPNGAGKTSFIDALTGFARASGTIEFDGVNIESWSPHRRSRQGLVRTFQSVELFEDLTVGENLRTHADPYTATSWITDLVVPAHDESLELAPLEMIGLADLADEMPSELSHGTRRLVGIARALASKPRLLLLDEPAAGLDGGETALLGEKLRAIVASGIAVLLIDHDMELMMDICHDMYVLDFGNLIAHGDPTAIQADPAVRTAYLGVEEEEKAS
jgi:branched-chain amino acid transport system ATP-binding protein